MLMEQHSEALSIYFANSIYEKNWCTMDFNEFTVFVSESRANCCVNVFDYVCS